MSFHAIHRRAALALAAGLCLMTAPPALAAGTAQVSHLTYDRTHHGLVFDISGPVAIGTRSLQGPPRLVVDVSKAVLLDSVQRLALRDPLIRRVRVSQFAYFPPVVRVVLETRGPSEPLLAVQQTGRHLYISLAREHYKAMAVRKRLKPARRSTAPKSPPGLLGEPGLLPLPSVSPLDTRAPHGQTMGAGQRPRYIPSPPPFRGTGG